jgi:hypothetical protein
MQDKFLSFLFVIGIFHAAADNYVLTTEERQIALCVDAIVHQYFAAGQPVFISMLRDEPDPRRSLLSLSPYNNNVGLVTFTLHKLHESLSWPLRLFPPEITLSEGDNIIHSYIIFLWSQDDADVTESLRTQVDTLKEQEGAA